MHEPDEINCPLSNVSPFFARLLINHKAAFKGCQPEFQSLVSRLIKQLESELNSEKIINRDN